MTSKELNIKLISFLPEIKEAYEECISWQEGESSSSHIVFGCVLVPYIIECANTHNIEKLKKCLRFIELVLSYEDLYSEEVIAYSVLENLMFSDELHIDICEFLGDKSKRIYNEVKDEWENARKNKAKQ